MNQEIRRLDWQECPGDIGAQLLEARLVKALKPLHNRHLKQSPTLFTWRLDDLGEGWLKPRLVEAQTQDFSLEAPCYGLFKTQREALEILRALATEHRLCATLLGVRGRSTEEGIHRWFRRHDVVPYDQADIRDAAAAFADFRCWTF